MLGDASFLIFECKSSSYGVCNAFVLNNQDASRESHVDNEGFANIHTKTQLSTGASREAPVHNGFKSTRRLKTFMDPRF